MIFIAKKENILFWFDFEGLKLANRSRFYTLVSHNCTSSIEMKTLLKGKHKHIQLLYWNEVNTKRKKQSKRLLFSKLCSKNKCYTYAWYICFIFELNKYSADVVQSQYIFINKQNKLCALRICVLIKVKIETNDSFIAKIYI